QMPALRVLINRDAHIFPYTWARQIFFDKIVIRCNVGRVSYLVLINEQGQQDNTSSFYPFGVRGEKGSWLVAGNYEASIKPLREVSLKIKWQQIPQEAGGFEEYYKDYNKGIHNDSFRVKAEYMKGKEWVEASNGQIKTLFTTDNKTGMVSDNHIITWNLDEKMPINALSREEFRYGLSPAGFFRLKLEQPDFGFGYSVYQNLFINNILLRSGKEAIKPLNEPFVPIVDSVELQYKAEETISKHTIGKSQTRLYYITPIATQSLQPITDHVYALVNGSVEEGYLKFSFSKAESYSTIRMHIELIPSHHEFEKSDISPLKWFYYDGKHWEAVEEKNVLDETENFLNSGIIEIELPMRISEEHLDKQGLFWIYAAFEKNHLNYPSVYGMFTNVVKVEAVLSDHPEHHSGTGVLPAGSIRELQKNIPGITSIRQSRAGRGGVDRECFNSMYFRTSNQIRFRNQPVTPEDYERIVLEKFPQVDKVKCFPSCDTKNNGRKGVVTLAVMQKKQNDTFPLCSYDLLFDIEREISLYTNPFVIVDAINPVFEEVMLRCYLKLRSGVSVNLFQKEIKTRINHYIAPWIEQNRLPEFGQTLTVAGMRSFLEQQPEIEEIHKVSLVVLMLSTQKADLESQTIQKLLEFTEEKANVPIKTSHPWYIRVPAEEHLIYTHMPKEEQEKMGIGEFKVGSTFIIKK
ncbi:baseplate J/gp47 family protein, partial [Bacteroides sp. OttesenSCG-928-F21]|nr:baseplate J/gp47 family protein [Bacteroides sp. OttesenSCG-928-F21]